MLYDSIHVLPLNRFIICYCEGDLSQLAIDTTVPRETLIPIWEKVYEQFLDGIKDKEGLHRARLMGKINHLEFTYKLIQLCVKFLTKGFSPEVLSILSRHVRVVGQFNPDDPESYYRDLQVVLNWGQRLLVDIEGKKAELAAISPKGEQKQATRQHFDRLIASVSMFTGFHIDKKTVTVGEFVEYYVTMREAAEQRKKTA